MNTYSDVAGASVCTACPEGKYTGENDRMTYCLNDPTGSPTSQPTSPTILPTQPPVLPPTEGQSENGVSNLASNDAIIGALVAAGLICCLGICACYYIYYFRKKRLEADNGGISPYEKWMAIEEAKKAGKNVQDPNINFANANQKPAPINLEKREVHNLHHAVGTEGYVEKKRKGSILEAVKKRVSGTGPITKLNAGAGKAGGSGNRLSTIRASEADVADIYGRDSRTSKFAGVGEDGFAEVLPDNRGSAVLETTNPMYSGGGGGDSGNFSGMNPLADPEGRSL